MTGEYSPLMNRLRDITNPTGARAANSSPLKKANKEWEKNAEKAQCDFCGKPISQDHKHFADLNEMKFMCTCEMCAILQAEKGEYKPVPDRYQYLEDCYLPEEIWLQLKIPVNMAFIVYNSAQQKPIAFYPSPAGATESELYLKSWDTLKQKNPALKNMAADLEGFMINRLDEPHEHYIVPIDCCYKLIGLIRITWQGMHGGKEMRNSVRRFFKDLKKKSV